MRKLRLYTKLHNLLLVTTALSPTWFGSRDKTLASCDRTPSNMLNKSHASISSTDIENIIKLDCSEESRPEGNE